MVELMFYFTMIEWFWQGVLKSAASPILHAMTLVFYPLVSFAIKSKSPIREEGNGKAIAWENGLVV
jgi:hypothetical protein